MAKFGLIFFSFLFSLQIFAKTNFLQENGKDVYVETYQSNGVWVVDRFEVVPGKMQERVEQKIFPDKKKMKRYLDIRYRNLFNSKARPRTAFYVETESPEKIWEVKHQWSQEWERKFSQWVKENFNKEFYVKHQIKTDCADVAFSLRWIFSRIHGLPAANTLAGTGMLFTQDSMKESWKNLKRSSDWREDQVFMSALRYLLINAYTRTLNRDTYPIELNKETFLIGTIHLDGGHTMIISEINYDQPGKAPIKKLWSTVPAAIRELGEGIMTDSHITEKEYGGLVRMRWPIKKNGRWSLIPKKSMEFYSEEQYTDAFRGDRDSFTLALIDRLGMDFKPKTIISESISTIESALNQRVDIVNEGFDFCSKNNCEEGSFNYEEHSTPTRDGRITKQFETLLEMGMTFSDFDPSISAFIEQELKNRYLEIQGVSNSLDRVRELFQYDLISHHPDDEPAQRWAIDSNSVIAALLKRKERGLGKREKLLSKGENCRRNGCARESLEWKKSNTYELDEKIKKSVLNAALKAQEIFPDSQKIAETLEEFFSLAFLVSEPSATLKERRGELSFDTFLVPYGKNISQVTDDLFYVDNSIWSISQRKYIAEYDSALWDEKNNRILASKNGDIVFLDLESLEEVKVGRPVTSKWLFWVSENEFATTNCPKSYYDEYFNVANIQDTVNTTSPLESTNSNSVDVCEFSTFKISETSIEKRETYLVFAYLKLLNNKLTPPKKQATLYLDEHMDLKLLVSFGDTLKNSTHEVGSFVGEAPSGIIIKNSNGVFQLQSHEESCKLDSLEKADWLNIFKGTDYFQAEFNFGIASIYRLKKECGVEKILESADNATFYRTEKYALIYLDSKLHVFDNNNNSYEVKLSDGEYVSGPYKEGFLSGVYRQAGVLESLFYKDFEGNIIKELDPTRIPEKCTKKELTCSAVMVDFIYNILSSDLGYIQYGDYYYRDQIVGSKYIDYGDVFSGRIDVDIIGDPSGFSKVNIKQGAMFSVENSGWLYLK